MCMQYPCTPYSVCCYRSTAAVLYASFYSFPSKYMPKVGSGLRLPSYFKTPVQHNKQRLTLASV